MWLSFWRSRDRFSIQELRYLTDQLQKVQIVNEVNKDFVIEALRSIAELLTYGDQHDASFFEFFMEKQVMGEFVRMLKVSRTMTISLQLLQTMSIMIQNLKDEHAIYYMFSNEHINFLITYSFDFQNEELLSYYISFLRATSGKLNKNTVSLLVKTQNEEVVSFPLYTEAIRFAFHEESMVRTAVRALTLNVYHVGDKSVNKYITVAPQSDYFSYLISFFGKRCTDLNRLVSQTLKNPVPDSNSMIIAAVDEIEDTLYYFSDVISAGIPEVGRLITDHMLQLLILPLLLPSLRINTVNEIEIGAVTSLYLLCCILRIVKIRDLANTIAAALFCPVEAFIQNFEAKQNGFLPVHDFTTESQQLDNNHVSEVDSGSLRVKVLDMDSSQVHPEDAITQNNCTSSHLALRKALLSYITRGDDVQVLGSVSVLATLLQTKELDESMLDALGILPQRKKHKKLLLQALVGEGSGEEQLFSAETNIVRDGINSELDGFIQKLKEQHGVSCSFPDLGTSPFVNRNQDSYKNCMSSLLQEIRGVWTDLIIGVLCDEWKKCKRVIEASSPRKEPKSMLMPLQKSSSEGSIPAASSFTAGERMCELVKVFVLLLQLQIFSLGRALPEQPPIYPPSDVPENSRARTAGLDILGPKPGTELRLGASTMQVLLDLDYGNSINHWFKYCVRVIIFLILYHVYKHMLASFSFLCTFLEENFFGALQFFSPSVMQIKYFMIKSLWSLPYAVDAVPCRIAFERGKERHFRFLAISMGTSGWIVLAEELPLKQQFGIVRVAAPLAGSNPRIDEKHSRWLHLRIRPSTLPFVDPTKFDSYGKPKAKGLVDGRWILAFGDEESCKSAFSMILNEIYLQSNEVERRLRPLLDLEGALDSSILFPVSPEAASSSSTTSNSL